MILADDLGTDKVSSYADDHPTPPGAHLPQTLAIDGLAASGLRFQRAWATPICSPTRASIQAGVYPFRHGIGGPLHDSAAGLDPTAFDLLGEVAAAQGYATGYFGKWHLGTRNEAGRTWNQVQHATPSIWVRPHPALAGWADFTGTLESVIGDYHAWTALVYHEAPAPGAPPGSHEVYTTAVDTHATLATAAEAVGWIDRQAGPWLAFVAFHGPHAAQAVGEWTYDDVDPTCVRSPALACLATRDCADEALAAYQGQVECVDLQVEALLGGIDPAVLDDTLVVFLGDNGTPPHVQEGDFASEDLDGDGVGDRGKGSVYETGIRVPFVVADGATWRTGAAGRIAAPGRVVSAGIHVVDLYETLHVELTGAPSASPDARTFADCFTATDAACRRKARLDYTERFEVASDGAVTGSAAVRYGHDKLVAEYDPERGCLAATFYRTDQDPFEREPLSWTGDRAARLQDHLLGLHAGMGSWADGVPFCVAEDDGLLSSILP